MLDDSTPPRASRSPPHRSRRSESGARYPSARGPSSSPRALRAPPHTARARSESGARYPSASVPSASCVLRQPQEIEAGALEHLAVLRIQEAQPVLVDDLDLHAFPFPPARRADAGQDFVFGLAAERDPVRRWRVALTTASLADDAHPSPSKRPL